LNDSLIITVFDQFAGTAYLLVDYYEEVIETNEDNNTSTGYDWSYGA